MTVQEWLGQDNKLGIDIWNKKYRYKNETFDEWLDRVSNKNDELKQLIKERKFLFGGRTLANRGTNKKGSFSNCYSRGFVQDDLDDIMQSAKDIALTFKAQGGQGLSLSKLRPKGCGINNNQFKSDGIIPFMEIYNRVTESISQGGSRKGALIMTLDVWHKEAEDFIKIKSEEGRIQKANLSLEIDDDFMKCVKHYYETGEKITKHIVRNYDGNTVEYDVTPIDLYKLMMEKAYDWAEPGCIYTNRFRNYNMMEYDNEYMIESCNPCGEQPLPKHAACNLGSINLSEFVKHPFTDYVYFDQTEFIKAVEIAVEALDTVLDENMNNHPLKEQRDMAFNYRNIGLGIMGLHDFLIKLGITYGSEESKEIIDTVMRTMFRTAVIKSSELAKEKGKFPKYKEHVLDSEIIKNHFTCSELEEYGIIENGIRNCSLLSIAPSGSIGTMLNISTGCEPLFQISYKRKTVSLNGEEKYYNVYSGIANEYINKYNKKSLPNFFNTSSDINWGDRVDIQSVLQRHVDTAISSTINLPKDITLEEIEKLYLYAWEKGLKGVTIFRDGCSRMGILTTEESNNNDYGLELDSIIPITRSKLGKRLDGTVYLREVACGKLYITISRDENNNIVEVFVDSGKSGGCAANTAALGRYASACLRTGMKVDSVVDITKNIVCSACTKVKGKGIKEIDGLSCSDVVARVIEEEYKRLKGEYSEPKKNKQSKESKQKEVNKEVNNDFKCPECNTTLINDGGCRRCPECGWSKCD